MTLVKFTCLPILRRTGSVVDCRADVFSMPIREPARRRVPRRAAVIRETLANSRQKRPIQSVGRDKPGGNLHSKANRPGPRRTCPTGNRS